MIALSHPREKTAGAPGLMAEPPTQVVVLGMHRSGTSAVTHLLHLMGCYGGPEHRFPTPDEANPTGYWENSDVVILNDALLAASDAAWSDPAGLDLSRLSEPPSLREQARELVRELDLRGPWVMKDPRLCLLLPFWLEVLEKPAGVLVWREPLPVARSLADRDGFPIPLGIALWELHIRAALASSQGLPRTLVSYHELMGSPMRVLRRLREELTHLGVPGLRLPGEEEIESFLDPALNRHPRDPEAQRRYLTPPQIELLELLESGAALSVDPVPPLSPGALDLLTTHRRSLEKERSLQWQIANGEVFLGELQARVAELARENDDQARASAEQRERLSAERERASAEAGALDDLLGAVFVSRSWRIGHALSRLFRLFRPSSQPSAADRWRRLRTTLLTK